MNPLIQHLTEELQAIIKALDENNPGRAHWLARTALTHISKCLNSDTPAGHPFTGRQLATVLAALRYWQQDLEANEDPPISDHFTDHDPLTPEEIDSLCEQLNQ